MPSRRSTGRFLTRGSQPRRSSLSPNALTDSDDRWGQPRRLSTRSRGIALIDTAVSCEHPSIWSCMGHARVWSSRYGSGMRCDGYQGFEGPSEASGCSGLVRQLLLRRVKRRQYG
eukprot:359748-Chlamydomonas_euryale.AAC.2